MVKYMFSKLHDVYLTKVFLVSLNFTVPIVWGSTLLKVLNFVQKKIKYDISYYIGKKWRPIDVRIYEHKTKPRGIIC